MKSDYNTEQRCLVEKFLMDNDDEFFSSKDILEYFNKKNYNVGLTTIYRTLSILEKKNKVRTEMRDHTKYYQYTNQSCLKHFHLKCKICGKIEHLNCKEFEAATKHVEEEHHFELDYNTIIYGICGKCSKKLRRMQIMRIIKNIILSFLILSIVLLGIIAQESYHIETCHEENCIRCNIIIRAQIIMKMLYNNWHLLLIVISIFIILCKIKIQNLVMINNTLIIQKVQFNE